MKDRSFYPIIAIVLLAHAMVLVAGVFFTPTLSIKPHKEKLVVSTVRLKALPLLAEVTLQDGKSLGLPPEPENKPVVPEPTQVEEVGVPNATAGVEPTPIPPSEKPQPKPAPKKQPPPPPKPKPKPKPKPAAPVKPATPKPAAPQKAPPPFPSGTPTSMPNTQAKAEEKRIQDIARTQEAARKQQVADNLAKEEKKAQESARKQQLANEAADNLAKEEKKAQEAARKRQLLNEAAQSLAKVEASTSSSSKGTVAVAAPKKLEGLSVENVQITSSEPLGPGEKSYRGELVSRLKLQLHLPEYGQVKVNLTLDRFGKVLKVLVQDSKSAVNKKYVETSLPSLHFSPFGSYFPDEKEHTFNLLLQNDV